MPLPPNLTPTHEALLTALLHLSSRIWPCLPLPLPQLHVVLCEADADWSNADGWTFRQLVTQLALDRPHLLCAQEDRLVYLTRAPIPLASTRHPRAPPASHRDICVAQLSSQRQDPRTYLCPFRSLRLCVGERGAGNCPLVHFSELVGGCTDVRLGDCSYLDTCHRPHLCRFLHYADPVPPIPTPLKPQPPNPRLPHVPPPSPIRADLSAINLPKTLGTHWDVIIADPPWDIAMQLPYTTLGDSVLLGLDVGGLQVDGGLMALWTTNRTSELGRRCLSVWGYEVVEEVVWVKVNGLHRTIKSGRTGHWLNHSKEHVLVAVKGGKHAARFHGKIDTNVIVAEVMETSRKPVDLYQMLERLVDGWVSGEPWLRSFEYEGDLTGLKCSKKLELFGRTHNLRPGWTTVGDQV